MEIEIVRMNRFDSMGNTKAFCDISLDGKVVIKGFKVILSSRDNELFVGLPSEKGKDGNYYNTFVPMNEDFSYKLKKTILDYYNKGDSYDVTKRKE